MKRRSLFIPTGLSLLGSAGLAAYSGGRPAGEGSAPAPKLKALRVRVPTTLTFMAPVVSFGTFGKLDGLVGETDMQNWASVDVIKSLIVGSETGLVAIPSYATANLFNRGPPVRLVAVTVWGMFYILGPEGSSTQGIEGLKGKKVGVPPPNSMPDLIFHYLMTQSGISLEGGVGSIGVVPYDQAPGLVRALMSGQVGYAVLPKHVATVAQGQVKQSGKNLDHIANLQGVWAKVTGGQVRFSMTDMMMPQKLADSNQVLVVSVLNELEEAVAKVSALGEKAVATITAKTETPEAVVEDMIPQLQLEMVPAQEAKTELEDFYTHLTTPSPDIVGGKMPADDFYLVGLR